MSGGFNWKSADLHRQRMERLARFADHLCRDNAIKRAAHAAGVQPRTAARYVRVLGLVAQAGRACVPASNEGTPMPVYIVEVTGTAKKLVDAPNQASARGHVARQMVTTKVATGKELFDLAKSGADIETVGEEAAAEPEVQSEPTAADGTERKVGEPRRPAKVD